jgi:hypothetical protein
MTQHLNVSAGTNNLRKVKRNEPPLVVPLPPVVPLPAVGDGSSGAKRAKEGCVALICPCRFGMVVVSGAGEGDALGDGDGELLGVVVGDGVGVRLGEFEGVDVGVLVGVGELDGEVVADGDGEWVGVVDGGGV